MDDSAINVVYEGLENAVTDYSTVEDNFTEHMNTLMDKVEKTTENDWRGPDASLFVSTTTSKMQTLYNQYDDFFKDLISTINGDSDKFHETQQKNMGQIDG